jgi:hypothetical protein
LTAAADRFHRHRPAALSAFVSLADRATVIAHMPPRTRPRPKSRTSSEQTLHDLFNAVAALKLHARVVEKTACAACRRKQRSAFDAVDRLTEEASRLCDLLAADANR